MKIQWDAFTAAIILLWTPILLIVPAALREKMRNPLRNRAMRGDRVALTWQNWVDFLRAAGGAWLLMEMSFYLPPDSDLGMAKLGIQIGVIVLGVWLQVLWHQGELVVIAPVFFLSAILLVMLPVQIGLFALILGVTIALMTGRFHWQLWTVPIALLGFAYFFKGLDLKVITIAGCYFIPIIMEMSAGSPVAFICSRSVSVSDSKNNRNNNL